jgi:hypothetical protein
MLSSGEWATAQGAITGRVKTRMIGAHVLSVQTESVVDLTEIAAAHHACGEFPAQATAFDPTASVDSQSLDRGF